MTSVIMIGEHGPASADAETMRELYARMREEFAVYAIESGRICVAALNTKNVDYSADAIAKVIA